MPSARDVEVHRSLNGADARDRPAEVATPKLLQPLAQWAFVVTAVPISGSSYLSMTINVATTPALASCSFAQRRSCVRTACMRSRRRARLRRIVRTGRRDRGPHSKREDRSRERLSPDLVELLVVRLCLAV